MVLKIVNKKAWIFIGRFYYMSVKQLEKNAEIFEQETGILLKK